MTADRRWRTIFIARGWRNGAASPLPRITPADLALVRGQAIILIVGLSGDLSMVEAVSPFPLHLRDEAFWCQIVPCIRFEGLGVYFYFLAVLALFY